MIDDPEAVKPDGWSSPATIADPEAEQPGDWDEEADGAWDAPQIPNPEYQPEWRAERIPNPAYTGSGKRKIRCTHCRTRDMGAVETSEVDADACPNGFANDNGRLVCDHPPADVAALLREGKGVRAWAAAADVTVLGLFRRSTPGKLHDAFQAAARAAHDGGDAAFGIYAESAYSAASKAWSTTPLEGELGHRAPAVLVSRDGGGSWTRCSVPHARTSTSVGDCINAIETCAQTDEPSDEL